MKRIGYDLTKFKTTLLHPHIHRPAKKTGIAKLTRKTIKMKNKELASLNESASLSPNFRTITCISPIFNEKSSKKSIEY